MIMLIQFDNQKLILILFQHNLTKSYQFLTISITKEEEEEEEEDKSY